MKRRESGSGIAASLVLLCFFALTALALALSGAKAYRAIGKRLDDNFSRRTALSYITNKIRQYDRPGMITAGSREGVSVLCIAEEYGSVRYETLIYCTDGAVRELFVPDGSELSLSAGMEIAPAGALEFAQSGGGIEITLTCPDGVSRAFIDTEEAGHE